MNVGVEVNGRRVTRSYSLSNAPRRDGRLEITIKHVPGGVVSTHLCQHLKVGDVTELVVPEKEDRYPSVEMFGWLPAHGIFCRHARGVTFENIELRLDAADVRHAVVLDDTSNITLRSVRVLHPGIEDRPAETLHRVTRSPGVRLNPRPAVIGTTPGWVLSTAE